jgi:type VI secretion system FHA domain protein
LRIPGGAGPDWFRTIGQIIGIYAAASAELLQTISAIKDTFSIHQTQIRGRDNNPLRWATPRQAVKRLLAPDEDGFLGPAAAVADTIAGIKGHQMGAIKGMEAAFKAFLLDLDPTKLARDFEAHGAPGILANKKAWYWDQYAKSYQRLTESARENYLDLLGDAFCEAYEQQVRIIREEAKRNAPG